MWGPSIKELITLYVSICMYPVTMPPFVHLNETNFNNVELCKL